MLYYNEEAQQKEFTDAVIKKDYKKQALILISIADKRLEEAISLDYSINPHLKYHYFAKSASLYSAALIRISKDNKSLQNWQEKSLCFAIEAAIKSRISLIEQEFLKSINVKINEAYSYIEQIKKHKNKLIKIRDKAKEAIENLDENNPYNLMNELDVENYDSNRELLREEIKTKEVKRAEQIREIYLTSTNDMKILIKGLLSDCIIELGKPPCSYAILGLGSLARSEMTPYSDLEFAIIIEDQVIKLSAENYESEGTKYNNDNKIYFRNLAALLHLKIINLGETSLGVIGEDWFEKLYKEKFGDYDELACGFCFDGQFARACRSPLGNMHIFDSPNIETSLKEKRTPFELIGTIDELIKFQTGEWIQNDKLLVLELANVEFIFGSEKLFDKYKNCISTSNNIELRKQIGAFLLNKDLKKFESKIEGAYEGKLYEIKKEIYRLPDRIIENLSLLNGHSDLRAWDRINKLVPLVFNDIAANNLKVALGISMELRLRVYLHYNKRAEKTSIIAPIDIKMERDFIVHPLADIFYLPVSSKNLNSQILFRFYYTILPLQDEIETFMINNQVQINHNLYDNGLWLRSRILAKLLKYEEAIQLLEIEIKEDIKFISEEKNNKGYLTNWKIDDFNSKIGQLTNWCITINDYKKNEYYNKLLSEIMNSGTMLIIPKNDKALLHIEELKKINLYNEAVAHNAKGIKNLAYGNHVQALESFKQALKIYTKLDRNQEIIEVKGNILCLYLKQHEVTNSIEFINGARQELQEVFQTLNKLDIQDERTKLLKLLLKYQNNLLNFCKGKNYYDAKKELTAIIEEEQNYYPNSHPMIIKMKIQLALTLANIDIEESLKIYQRLLPITKKMYKTEIHSDVVNVLSNLGNIYIDLKRFDHAIKNLEDAQKICEKLSMPDLSIGVSINLIRAILMKGNMFLIQNDEEASDNNAMEIYEQAALIYNPSIKKEEIKNTICSSMFFSMAESAYSNKKLDEALSHYKACVKIFSSNEQFRNKLSQIENIKNIENALLRQYSKNTNLSVCKFNLYSTQENIKKYLQDFFEEVVDIGDDGNGNWRIGVSEEFRLKIDRRNKMLSQIKNIDESINNSNLITEIENKKPDYNEETTSSLKKNNHMAKSKSNICNDISINTKPEGISNINRYIEARNAFNNLLIRYNNIPKKSNIRTKRLTKFNEDFLKLLEEFSDLQLNDNQYPKIGKQKLDLILFNLKQRLKPNLVQQSTYLLTIEEAYSIVFDEEFSEKKTDITDESSKKIKKLNTGKTDVEIIMEYYYSLSSKSLTLEQRYNKYVDKENYLKQACILIKFGDRELGKAIKLDYQEYSHRKYHSFAKSVSLYNAALIRINKYNRQGKYSEEIRSKIFFVEQKFLESINRKIDIDEDNYFKRSQEHKNFLEMIRKKIKKDIDELDNHNPYNLMLELDNTNEGNDRERLKEKIQEIEQNRAIRIKNLYTDITTIIKLFVKALFRECVDILGEPTCSYAILGLGSMARNEMTPYSDLEWAVIIEDKVEQKYNEIYERCAEESKGEKREKYEQATDQEISAVKNEQERNKQYFRNLATLLHIKIINLGETPLGVIGEEWLEKLYKEKFGDYDELACGFCFDGQFARACRTPLGNFHYQDISSEIEPFELIGTINELSGLQNREWQDLQNEKSKQNQNNKLLILELANADLLHGSIELFNKYKEKISTEEYFNKRAEIGSALLKEDIGKYRLKTVGNSREGKLFEIKKEIYRLVDRTVENLALREKLNLKVLSAWDRIENLPSKIFNSDSINNLKVALGISLELRLRVYQKYNKREESVVILSDSENVYFEDEARHEFKISDQGKSINIQILCRYYYTILPFQKVIDQILENSQEDNFGSLYNDGLVTKGFIFNKLARYQEASKFLEEACNKKEFGIYDAQEVINVLGRIYKKFGMRKKALDLYGKSLDFNMENNLDTEISNVITSSEHSILQLITFSDIGNIYVERKRYEEAIKIYQSVLKKITDISFEGGVTLNAIADVYAETGRFQYALENYDKALEIFKKIGKFDSEALTYNAVGNLYAGQKVFTEAKKNYDKSLMIFDSLYRPYSKIYTLNSIGHISMKYSFSIASQEYDKALKISIKYNLKKSEAITYISIGNLYAKAKGTNYHFTKALKNYKDALAIFKDFKFREYEARVELAIGKLYANAKGQNYNFNKALENYEKALGFFDEVYYQESRARTLLAMGDLYANAIGQNDHFSKALKNYEEALVFFDEVYDQEFRARILLAMGDLYANAKGQNDHFSKALEYYRKSFVDYEETKSSYLYKASNAILNLMKDFYDTAYNENICYKYEAETKQLYVDLISKLKNFKRDHLYNNLNESLDLDSTILVILIRIDNNNFNEIQSWRSEIIDKLKYRHNKFSRKIVLHSFIYTHNKYSIKDSSKDPYLLFGEALGLKNKDKESIEYSIKRAGDTSIKSKEIAIEYWLNYNEIVLENLLELRLNLALQTQRMEEHYVIRILKTKTFYYTNYNEFIHNKLISLVKNILVLYKDELNIKDLLLPILMPKGALVYHWVGITISKNDNTITLSYLDSENQSTPLIRQNILSEKLQKLLREPKIVFKQQELETQRYNNCGPELIENFVYYLTGTRATQEGAVYLQSLLYENSLLDTEFSVLQIEENNRIIAQLSNRVIPLYRISNMENILYPRVKASYKLIMIRDNYGMFSIEDKNNFDIFNRNNIKPGFLYISNSIKNFFIPALDLQNYFFSSVTVVKISVSNYLNHLSNHAQYISVRFANHIAKIKYAFASSLLMDGDVINQLEILMSNEQLAESFNVLHKCADDLSKITSAVENLLPESITQKNILDFSDEDLNLAASLLFSEELLKVIDRFKSIREAFGNIDEFRESIKKQAIDIKLQLTLYELMHSLKEVDVVIDIAKYLMQQNTDSTMSLAYDSLILMNYLSTNKYLRLATPLMSISSVWKDLQQEQYWDAGIKTMHSFSNFALREKDLLSSYAMPLYFGLNGMTIGYYLYNKKYSDAVVQIGGMIMFSIAPTITSAAYAIIYTSKNTYGLYQLHQSQIKEQQDNFVKLLKDTVTIGLQDEEIAELIQQQILLKNLIVSDAQELDIEYSQYQLCKTWNQAHRDIFEDELFEVNGSELVIHNIIQDLYDNNEWIIKDSIRYSKYTRYYNKYKSIINNSGANNGDINNSNENSELECGHQQNNQPEIKYTLDKVLIEKFLDSHNVNDNILTFKAISISSCTLHGYIIDNKGGLLGYEYVESDDIKICGEHIINSNIMDNIEE